MMTKFYFVIHRASLSYNEYLIFPITKMALLQMLYMYWFGNDLALTHWDQHKMATTLADDIFK